MKTVAMLSGLTTFVLAEAYALHLIYVTVNADGSWYNKLYEKHGRENVSFIQKLFFTVRTEQRQLDYAKVFALLTAAPLLMGVVVALVFQGGATL